MRKVALPALGLMLGLLPATPALAQAPEDGWRVTVAPYFMGAAMNGTTAIAGRELKVDMSASDIFSSLQFEAMGLSVARKSNWGVAGDAIWMALGANGTSPAPAATTGSADMNQGAFVFYGLRRFGPAADPFFGGRVNTLQANLRFNGPGQRTVDGSKTWFDPIVGLQVRTPDTGTRWHAQLYAEFGGFGVGSAFTWQIFPTFGVDLAQWASLGFGYRWLDIGCATGDDPAAFKWDVVTQGPAFGVGFKS
jgi:hypothetical protein